MEQDMEQDTAAGTVHSGLVLGAVRHHVVLILACALGGLLLAGAFTFVRPEAYVATASVLVNPAEGNPFGPEQEGEDLVSLETEAEVVESDAVTTLALARLPDGVSRSALQDGVRVTIPPNTQVLQISSRAPTAASAQLRAQAYATAYLDFRREQARRTVAAQLAAIEQQIAQATEDLQAANEAAAAAETSEELAFQQELAQALNDELVDLRAGRLLELQGSLTQPGRVISPAQLPSRPAGLGTTVVLFAGLLAGLLLGMAMALLRERRSDKVYDVADVESAGVPVVAAMPRRYRRYSDQDTPDDVIRHLRAHVMSSVSTPAVIAVATCSWGLAEPGIAARLSIFLHRAWARVILVDAAPGHLDPTGTLPRLRTPGLTELLLDEHADKPDLLVPVSSRLSVLPRGAHLEDALDRFLPHALENALGPLSQTADFVVLRVPSLAEAPGEAMLAVARHVVLVVVPGVSTRTDIAAALSTVTAAGAQMLGAVVSAPAPRWSRRRIGRRRAARRIGGPVVSPRPQRPLPHSRGATLRGGSASRPTPM